MSMSSTRLPIHAKCAFTLFMAVLVPVYWYHYGPTNFLYFCDIALFLTLAGVWWESPLLLSMAIVGIFLPQMVWVADFLGNCVGMPITGSTNYMFHAHKPFYLRALSSFHGWLPFFLLWMIGRLGYDRRAFRYWTVMAWVIILVCYFLLPTPPAPDGHKNLPVNVNYVYGCSDEQPQPYMPEGAWVLGLMIVLPLCFYFPVHLVLSYWKGIPSKNESMQQSKSSGWACAPTGIEHELVDFNSATNPSPPPVRP